MKKTLITLAATAVAAASVAQAATLDFTNPGSLPTEVTFAGDGSDVITLAGATTLNIKVDGADGSITVSDYSIGGVTINNTYRFFNYHDHLGGDDLSKAAFKGGTINFGNSGSLTISQDSGASLNQMGMKFTFTLDTVIETDDTELLAAGKAVLTRSLLSADGALWYRGGTGDAFTYTASGVDGATLTDMTGTADGNGALAKTLTVDSGVGAFQLYNADDNSTSVAYVVQYIAKTPASNVPEPATATLSLLALAGLAARRRRK